MSEPKLISPLLDNYIIGDAISNRNGVRSCPAITKDNGDRYIVKIVSIPSSQSKLDALLLSGAYPDEASALAYFKELSEEVVEEASILQKLSHLEGFIGFDSWQTEQMEGETGYDVYLLRPYRRTLDQQIRRHNMTHLSAVNLGIDICSALSVCQRSGYLYVDLKPTNIFCNEDKQYLVGDLGFVSLNSLKYASLPDKYRSAYTAPEVADAYSSINTTLGVYAAGLILYQVFNGGVLPFEGDTAPAQVFEPPMYADYEMAEIIAKACAPDPADRWQTPAEMGQALVSYMQRNTVNETPIIPPVEKVAEPEPNPDEEEPAVEEETDVENLLEIVGEEIAAEADDTIDSEIAEEVASEPSDPEPFYEEDDCGNLSFLEEMENDDTAPGTEDEIVDYSEISEEVSDILEQADDLIAHETPDPVVAPEPIDVPVPPLPVADEDEDIIKDASSEDVEADEEESSETAQCEESESDEESEDEQIIEDEIAEDNPKPDKKGKGKIVLRVFIIALITAGLLIGGLFLYQNYYLQKINNITLDGAGDSLSVVLDTEIEDNLLSVVCSDIYGNQLKAPVVNGIATFTELSSDKTYQIQVLVDGFHQLFGATTATYQSPAITTIRDFSAVTGAQDGSVILLFGLEGPDSENWKVTYSALGEEEEKVLTFSGHNVTIDNLTVGSEYTFRIEPETELYIDGNTQLSFTAQNVVVAENLYITECADGRLSATWSCPENAEVTKWIVRYVCNDGSEETIATDETAVTFEGVDHTRGFTVEVTAENMSMNARANIMAGSVSVSNFVAVPADNDLRLTWDSSSPISEEGWLLQYTIDGSGTKYTVTCADNEALIQPGIPGATYAFTLSSAAGSQVLNGELTYTADDAEKFALEGSIKSSNHFEISMYETDYVTGRDYKRLESSEKTTTFEIGEKASFIVRIRSSYEGSSKPLEVLYVIRTADGELVSCTIDTTTLSNLFNEGYCKLDIPSMPSAPGDYSITIYFNGAYLYDRFDDDISTFDFTVTA